MIVTCESCQVRFNLDESLIKESGSKVRCSKCHHIFTAYKPGPAEEISPPLSFEEGLQDQPEASAQEPLTFEEAAGTDAAEGLEAFSEESLDFDALESEGETEEEEFSLEDLGLEEDFALDEIEEPGEQATTDEEVLTEDEITVEDLGLEDEITSEEVSEPAKKSALEEELGDDFDLGDLDLGLEEEVTPEEAIPSIEDLGEEKAVADKDEIALDDFQLEEEPLPEPPGKEAPQEEPEEEISIEEPSVEETGAEDESMWMESDEALEVEGEMPSEPTTFPSAEEAEEYEEGPFPSHMPEEELLPKKRMSTPLLVLMIVVLVGGAAYGAYTVLKSLDVKIPFLESLTGEPQAKEEGLKLLENLVTSVFLDSQAEGRLFVIKGEVRNDYTEPRNFMRVKGAIYSKDGNLLQEQIVYCGNVLPDNKLQSLDIAVLQRVLNNRFGANKSNFRVPPGTALPFMVVFSNLPEELGEYSVEVVDSVAE